MGTTADKLNHLWEIKKGLCEEINKALVDGVEEVSLSGKFRDYKNKFEDHLYVLKRWVDRSLDTISSPLTFVRSGMFGYCTSLTSVSFPNATSIGENAFYNCTGLTSIPSTSFPNVTSIGDEAFRSCTNLTSASFPKVTSMGAYIFSGCSKLSTLALPSITSVSKSLFRYYEALSDLNISSVTYIDFPTATPSLTSVSIADDGAFYGCSKLTSLSLPGITTLVGATAKPTLWGSAVHYSVFRDSSLAFISLPNITNIGTYAFCDCSTLVALYIGTNTSTVCTLANTNAIPSSVSTIYVPSSLVHSYRSAKNWSNFADKIVAYTG